MKDLRYNRFFAFGCSWTHYVWPTWASIIADDLDIPFENWGVPGGGNQVIQSRLVECDLRNNLTESDLVIVEWTSWSREDRYLAGKWNCGGNIFNNALYDDDFIKKYWSWENDVIRNSTIIHTTNKAYKDIISYQMSFNDYPKFTSNMEFIPWLHKLLGKEPTNESVEKFYETRLQMPDTINYGENSKFNGKCMDQHPDIKSHLYIVEKQIYPKLGLTLKETTVDKYTDMHNRISRVLSPDDEYYAMVNKVYTVLDDMGIDLEKHRCHYGF